jgi:DNA modification methylase
MSIKLSPDRLGCIGAKPGARNSNAWFTPATNDLVKPFVNTDAVTFLNSQIPGSVDLVLTDPPYIISRKSGFKQMGSKGVKRFGISVDFGKWDNTDAATHFELMKTFTRGCYAALRDGGTIIVWYDVWKIESMANHLRSAGFHKLRLVEWLKTNPVPLNSKSGYLSNAREIAIVGIKGGRATFHSEYDNGVYSFPIHRDGGKRLHPTQKSLAITSQLIAKHSNKGDLVVDPFSGSGTHLVAARMAGRRYAGCELDPAYFEIASKRLMAAQPGELL